MSAMKHKQRDYTKAEERVGTEQPTETEQEDKEQETGKEPQEHKEGAGGPTPVPDKPVTVKDAGGTEFMTIGPSGEQGKVQVTVCGTTQIISLAVMQKLYDELGTMLGKEKH